MLLSQEKLNLALELAENRSCAEAVVFLSQFPAQEKLTLLFHLGKTLAEQGRHDMLLTLADCLPSAGSEWMIGVFWKGYAQYQRGETEKAVTSFNNAALGARNYLITDNSLPFVWHFLVLGGGLSFDCALDLLPPPLPPCAWDLPDPASLLADGRVLVMAADAVYLDRFAAGALDSLTRLEQRGGVRAVHLHLVGEMTGWPDFRVRLRQRFPGLTLGFSQEPLPATLTTREQQHVYFASARFLRAGAIQEQYQADLLITDCDAEFTPALARLEEWSEGRDLALYRQPTALPWLNCLVGVVMLRRTAAVAALLELFTRSLFDRLGPKTRWLQDQSAFWTAVRLAEARHGLTVTDLHQTSGAALSAVLITPCNDTEKKDLRT